MCIINMADFSYRLIAVPKYYRVKYDDSFCSNDIGKIDRDRQ